MALYHQLESFVFLALQSIHLLLVYNPPRFYILVLLVSVSLVILVKAGIFAGDVHSVNMVENYVGCEPNSGLDLGGNTCAVAVWGNLVAEEELEIGRDTVDKEHEGNDLEQSSHCSDMSKETNVIKNQEHEGNDLEQNSHYSYMRKEAHVRKYEDDKESLIEEEEEEDVEDLHQRVEAYIRRVQTRFHIERLA